MREGDKKDLKQTSVCTEYFFFGVLLKVRLSHTSIRGGLFVNKSNNKTKTTNTNLNLKKKQKERKRKKKKEKKKKLINSIKCSRIIYRAVEGNIRCTHFLMIAKTITTITKNKNK